MLDDELDEQVRALVRRDGVDPQRGAGLVRRSPRALSANCLASNRLHQCVIPSLFGGGVNVSLTIAA